MRLQKKIGNKGGEKYWRWYGFNQRVNWCAIFVSWCANGTGDIIFFDWNGDGHVQHVGIVEKVENDKVCTIEGNSKDEVRNKNYSLTNKSIYGYGSVN